MLDLINETLAKLIDKLKTKSPIAYGVIVLVLLVFVYTIEQCQIHQIEFCIFPEDSPIQSIVKYVSILIGFLLGSRTTNFVKRAEKRKAIKEGSK